MARFKVIFARAFKGYGKDKCSSFAAAIAYYALLSIFPLSVFAVTMAGYALRNDPDAQQRIIDNLMANLPLSEGEGEQSIRDLLTSVTKGQGGLGLLGALGAAYSASALFGALRNALNAVFRVERNRPLVQGKMLDLGMTIGLGLMLVLSLALTAILSISQRYSREWFGDLSALMDIVFGIGYFVLPLAVSGSLFAIAYKVIPHAEITWKDTLLGAGVAAFVFELLKLGFATYVSNFGNYNAVYGTLGFVIVFLFFAYLTAQIILLGAEITRAYTEVMTGAVPSVKAAIPRRHLSPVERVEAMVKGLFVSPDGHHEQEFPYKPARDTGMLSDEQAKQGR